MNTSMSKAIREHFPVPSDIRRQAALATWDLYQGPSDEGSRNDGDEDEPYVGFAKACDLIQAWCAEALHDVWYDSEYGEVMDHEPEGYSDEEDTVATVATVRPF